MVNDITLNKDNSLPILKGGIRYSSPRKSNSKLTINKISLPQTTNFDEKLAWICASLGFFENIDKNKNAARIFKEIFLAGTLGQVLTSTVVSQRIGMSRGATINHLNKLENAGLIEKAGKYYFTRQKTMKGIIDEIEDDLLHTFFRMKKVAKDIDKQTSQVINMK